MTPEGSEEVEVDPEARSLAAVLLRSLISGQITNDQFEDDFPISSDPALDAIRDTAWLYYSDTKEYHLKGPERLHPDEKRAIIRWNLFLGRVTYSKFSRFLRHLFGMADPTKKVEDFDASGHYPVWPFISKKDYLFALRNPKRLSGKSV
ncbi:MAG: hypothetical protein AAF066_00990 [Pseudomonadota bacterium]